MFVYKVSVTIDRYFPSWEDELLSLSWQLLSRSGLHVGLLLYSLVHRINMEHSQHLSWHPCLFRCTIPWIMWARGRGVLWCYHSAVWWVPMRIWVQKTAACLLGFFSECGLWSWAGLHLQELPEQAGPWQRGAEEPQNEAWLKLWQCHKSLLLWPGIATAGKYVDQVTF